MSAEHLKGWLATTLKAEKGATTMTSRARTKENRGAPEVQPATKPTEAENWEMVVDLVQLAFREGGLV